MQTFVICQHLDHLAFLLSLQNLHLYFMVGKYSLSGLNIHLPIIKVKSATTELRLHFLTVFMSYSAFTKVLMWLTSTSYIYIVYIVQFISGGKVWYFIMIRISTCYTTLLIHFCVRIGFHFKFSLSSLVRKGTAEL